MGFTPADFKSAASANSATGPCDRIVGDDSILVCDRDSNDVTNGTAIGDVSGCAGGGNLNFIGSVLKIRFAIPDQQARIRQVGLLLLIESLQSGETAFAREKYHGHG